MLKYLAIFLILILAISSIPPRKVAVPQKKLPQKAAVPQQKLPQKPVPQQKPALQPKTAPKGDFPDFDRSFLAVEPSEIIDIGTTLQGVSRSSVQTIKNFKVGVLSSLELVKYLKTHDDNLMKLAQKVTQDVNINKAIVKQIALLTNTFAARNIRLLKNSKKLRMLKVHQRRNTHALPMAEKKLVTTVEERRLGAIKTEKSLVSELQNSIKFLQNISKGISNKKKRGLQAAVTKIPAAITVKVPKVPTKKVVQKPAVQKVVPNTKVASAVPVTKNVSKAKVNPFVAHAVKKVAVTTPTLKKKTPQEMAKFKDYLEATHSENQLLNKINKPKFNSSGKGYKEINQLLRVKYSKFGNF